MAFRLCGQLARSLCFLPPTYEETFDPIVPSTYTPTTVMKSIASTVVKRPLPRGLYVGLGLLLVLISSKRITLANPAVPTIILQYTSFKQITDDISDARVIRGDTFSNRPGSRCGPGPGCGQRSLQAQLASRAVPKRFSVSIRMFLADSELLPMIREWPRI